MDSHGTESGVLSLEDKSTILIKDLKAGYSDRCKAVQSIPLITDDKKNIKTFFVEGGIRFLAKDQGDNSVWNRLDSYKDIRNDYRVKSKRTIIQADSGYGKTFLSLLFAYDWYTQEKGSPLCDVDILIILQLRQLGNKKLSIYRAIRKFLLPKGSKITARDIEEILSCKTKSVLIIFDGYDEYKLQTDPDSVVNKIIACDMLPQIDVILTSRYLPSKFNRSLTSILELYGFDEKAREEYLKRVVVGDDVEKCENIKRQLTENLILEDLCKVPILFVAFSHMSDQQRMTRKVNTARKFFHELVTRIHDHSRIKADDQFAESMLAQFCKNTSHELNKLAFENLTHPDKHLAQSITEICDKIGGECYKYFKGVGILVEEEVVENFDDDNIQTTTKPRFCHPLFCEWYASFHLALLARGRGRKYDQESGRKNEQEDMVESVKRNAVETVRECERERGLVGEPGRECDGKERVGTTASGVGSGMDSEDHELKDAMKCLNPMKFQYLYRFACGPPTVAKNIIENLIATEAGLQIITLCIHEYPGLDKDVAPSIMKICSGRLTLAEDDNRLYQSSTITMLEKASRLEIPIRFVQLKGSFHSTYNADSNWYIKLQSGLSFPPLTTLERLNTTGKEDRTVMKGNDVIGILKYAEGSTTIRLIIFQLCELPLSINTSDLSHLKTTEVTIAWMDCGHILNRQSGLWQLTDKFTIEETCRIGVCIFKNSSKASQELQLKLLENASRNGISIYVVKLIESFHTVNQSGDIILHCGLKLPKVSSLEKLYVGTAIRGRLTESDVKGIMRYAEHATTLKEICFQFCDIPSYIRVGNELSALKSKDVQVTWADTGSRFNYQTGHWEVYDKNAINDCCRLGILIDGNGSKQTQNQQVDILKVASENNIPIRLVKLLESFLAIGESGDITLRCGIHLPQLITIERLQIINEPEGRISVSNIEGLMNYTNYSTAFKELSFQFCDMPASIPVGNQLSTYQSKGVKVAWLDCGHCLNNQSGQWEMGNMDAIRETCNVGVSINKNWSEHAQRLQISLLTTASNNNIPIILLKLNQSFRSVSESGEIILQNGLRIPKLKSVEGLKIEVDEGGRMSERDVKGLISHVKESTIFRELRFKGCDMPPSIVGPSPPVSKGIKVSWIDTGHRLDNQSGQWEATHEMNHQESAFVTLLASCRELKGESRFTNGTIGDMGAIVQSCSDGVTIRGHWSRHAQILQNNLLRIASQNNVHITYLRLINCYRAVDAVGNNIALQSGLPIPALSTLKMILIEMEYGSGRRIDEKEFLLLLKYAEQCGKVVYLRFQACELPLSIPPSAISSSMKSKDIKVAWLDCAHHFNLQSCQWELDNIDAIRASCEIGFVMYKHCSSHMHDIQIRLLSSASRHNIPIHHLRLCMCYGGVTEDGSGIILQSGPYLPALSSLKIFVLQMEHCWTVTKKEFERLIQYAGHSKVLNLLSFQGCDMPSTVSPNTLAILKSMNTKVVWMDCGHHLNFQKCEWELSDLNTIMESCDAGVVIYKHSSYHMQNLQIRLLSVAAENSIPANIGLRRSYSKIDSTSGDIILQSGLTLPSLTSAEVMVIYTEPGQSISREEMIGLIEYARRSIYIKQLRSCVCDMPSSDPKRTLFEEGSNLGGSSTQTVTSDIGAPEPSTVALTEDEQLARAIQKSLSGNADISVADNTLLEALASEGANKTAIGSMTEEEQTAYAIQMSLAQDAVGSNLGGSSTQTVASGIGAPEPSTVALTEDEQLACAIQKSLSGNADISVADNTLLEAVASEGANKTAIDSMTEEEQTAYAIQMSLAQDAVDPE